jgi:hypothetical protein
VNEPENCVYYQERKCTIWLKLDLLTCSLFSIVVLYLLTCSLFYHRLLTILHSQNKCKIVSFVSLQKLHSWVSFNLHLNRRELAYKVLYNILYTSVIDNVIWISAQHIILGSDMLDYSINLFIFLIKYYIYFCKFSGQKRCVSDVINILKRTYETEIQSVSFYQTPAIREMNYLAGQCHTVYIQIHYLPVLPSC